MIKICKPFKSCTPNKLTQEFSEYHKANDYASFYSDYLVAPFNCKIATIRTTPKLDYSDFDLKAGCGIRMVSIEDPTISCVYWHCLPVFPVSEGDTVLQGQPVACMGNTGWVESNGVYVPINIRLFPPFPGTHVHLSISKNDVPFDFSKNIDWTIPVNFDLKATIQNTVNKILSLLK
ncbi:M23 family metallopeptidase [Candidatus Dojkabacteria bacterium]|nr:M23 family metallopeptidase [Candidatus Dojkabacteria bacterium]